MSIINAGNKGLANLGNTCYMNSALQCLSHLLTFHPFNEVFQAECVSLSDGSLMKEWYEFQRKMWSNKEDDAMVNPLRLLQCFQKQCMDNDVYFENFDQNDADEFLVLFLDLIHRGIRRQAPVNIDINEKDPVIRKANDVWKNFYEKDYSYIVNQFHSQMIGITSCPECEYITTNHEPIQVISLEIPRKAKSLGDCLKSHTSLSHLDRDNQWTCDECHEETRAIQRQKLWKTSDIMIFLLKRYSNTIKITRFIEYEEIFDTKPYSLSYRNKNNTKYSLQGISIHDGSLGGGHYYAYCRNNLDDRWREYNDTTVREITREDALNTNGYIFFYKRV